eukprot:TRINITY_DN6492_c0_g1_i1.p1 TRINITY_DN6492_c0_g1~~TRINITY_DN6492_c0_g1_i1.p1  ORF type:complete len:211 (-),score=42.53 TRINITY_DN6492_c0_g1_i1:7-639(-)
MEHSPATISNLESLKLQNGLGSLRGIGALRKLKVLFQALSCEVSKLPIELRSLDQLEELMIHTELTHLPVWLASMRSLARLWCSSGRPVVGVVLDDNSTVLSFEELAAQMSTSPEHQQQLIESFLGLLKRDELKLLRTARMQFSPRATLREQCMTRCAAYRSVIDLQRLPAHIRDEILRTAGTEDDTFQEEKEVEKKGAVERPRKRARVE